MKSIMPAMQEATKLICARDLAGATRLIQQALNGLGSAPEPETEITTHRLREGAGSTVRPSESASPARGAHGARTGKPLGDLTTFCGSSSRRASILAGCRWPVTLTCRFPTAPHISRAVSPARPAR